MNDGILGRLNESVQNTVSIPLLSSDLSQLLQKGYLAAIQRNLLGEERI